MNMSDEQKGRFTALHKRKADLGWAMVEHTGSHEFKLYAAEIKKIDSEIDELMREVLGEDAYEEYRRALE